MASSKTQNIDERSYRLSNIDMMRGLVMVIMALDHVRDYFYFAGSGTSISDPSIDLSFYLTRWVTHFCAPVFVLFAGTSIGFMQLRRSNRELSIFLVKRGLWLIFCEVFIVSTAFTFTVFDPHFGGNIFAFLQVIWALGVGMIIMAGAIYLGARNCLILGIAILIGQELIAPFWPQGFPFGEPTAAWITLLAPGTFTAPLYVATVGYPPVQWAAIMMIGYGTVDIFLKTADERDSQLRLIGTGMIVAFFILRSLDLFGDPNPWKMQELGIQATIFDFMDLSKYPPSLLFFLITIGPMSILCSYADRLQGRFKEMLVMFGRVPFAYYILHFYLVHTLAVVFGLAQGYEANQIARMFIFLPEGYGTNLIGVYVVWILVIAILYPFCNWMMHLKSSRKDWWLSYL